MMKNEVYAIEVQCENNWSEKKPLVSVIIPTYNSMSGTKNIEATLKSIMEQSYSPIEVIVVDSYSKDSTEAACKKFPICFFQFSGTRSEARNFGIDNAHGDYVLFVDSDHVLTSSVVEDCVNQILFNNADCVMIPIEFLSVNHGFIDCSEMRNLEFAFQLGNQTLILFYSKKIIKNIRFSESIELGEDMVFSAAVLKNNPKVSVATSHMYHFEDGSLSSLIRRSWYYGKKFRSTVSEIGFGQSSQFILAISALNISKLISNNNTLTNSKFITKSIQFIVYALLKHASFGISYCLSLL